VKNRIHKAFARGNQGRIFSLYQRRALQARDVTLAAR